MNQPQTIPGTYSQWPGPDRAGPLRKPWTPAHFFWVWLFLSPLFFARIFIGGEIESYDNATGVGFFALGYVVHAVIILYYLTFAKHRPHSKQFSYLIIVLLILSSIFHAALLTLTDAPGVPIALLAIGRNTMWVVCCVAISNIIDQDLMLKGLLWFTHFTFAIILVTTAIYYVTGIPINIIFHGSTARAQGMMTEPSAVSGILGGYVALALSRKQTGRFFLGLFVALLVNSVIAIMAVLVGIITGWLSRSKMSRRFLGPARLIFFLIFPAMIVIAPIYAHEISQMANDAMNYLDYTTFGQTTLYQVFVLRFLQAASVLESGLDSVALGENQIDGGLFRFTSVMLLVNSLTESWRWLCGYGLGAHAQLMIADNKTILDFGLLPFFVSSYGFIVGVGLLAVLLKSIGSRVSPLLIFATPFTAVSILNSAGGIHGYSVVVVTALLALTEKSSEKKDVPLRPIYRPPERRGAF
jgi:hypothetical protein